MLVAASQHLFHGQRPQWLISISEETSPAGRALVGAVYHPVECARHHGQWWQNVMLPLWQFQPGGWGPQRSGMVGGGIPAHVQGQRPGQDGYAAESRPRRRGRLRRAMEPSRAWWGCRRRFGRTLRAARMKKGGSGRQRPGKLPGTDHARRCQNVTLASVDSRRPRASRGRPWLVNFAGGTALAQSTSACSSARLRRVFPCGSKTQNDNSESEAFRFCS
jgi:hypothetical protein